MSTFRSPSLLHILRTARGRDPAGSGRRYKQPRAPDRILVRTRKWCSPAASRPRTEARCAADLAKSPRRRPPRRRRPHCRPPSHLAAAHLAIADLAAAPKTSPPPTPPSPPGPPPYRRPRCRPPSHLAAAAAARTTSPPPLRPASELATTGGRTLSAASY